MSNSVIKPSLASEDSPDFPPLGVDPIHGQMIQNLRRANQIAIRSAQAGHHPFGAILVAPDQDTVLLEQGNVDSVNHAEAVLARAACTQFTRDLLWNCTIYSTVEPCVMCAGTQYWANIGRLVYGIAEQQLLALTGNHPENPTLDLPCRSVFERGQKKIKVWGPFPEVEAEIMAIHQDFWTKQSPDLL
ncbi:MAG: nucleoside deaminase [Thermosynechococcaceae cyanobacterium MS004]|nr:nucleoside deaminase [Thermosynechococcaceae cyanobacterium MS004]